MANAGYDQSAHINCKQHGKRYAAIWVMPESGEYFPAFYACMHCMKSAGISTNGQITKEQALSLRRLG